MRPRAAERAPALREVAVVAIGRNEGERLARCLDALPAGLRDVVYVDSASTDGSVVEARRRGIDVVALDLSTPFTAARARNAGLARLRARHPGLAFVQVLDGDCALAPGWLPAALAAMGAEPRLAVACGRRRELHPERSIYNRLADVEWDTPVGEAEACGGDALLRLAAVEEVGGYDERLIAGEEPELCARLRERGWRIRRLDHDMTFHDAAMTRFAQWWRRATRSGYGFADVAATRPGTYARQLRSALFWGALLPAAALLSAPLTGGVGLVLLAGYPVLWLRIVVRRTARGDRPREAIRYATFCVLGKLPEAIGVARRAWDRRRKRRARIIEYK